MPSSYSPLFQTLHDEIHPVGKLGRGAHYSVLRAPIWQSVLLKPLKQGAVLDFAVIWDHDDGVIGAILVLNWTATRSVRCYGCLILTAVTRCSPSPFGDTAKLASTEHSLFVQEASRSVALCLVCHEEPMMSVPSDAEVLAYIRARLAEGTLASAEENQKIYAGYGEDQPCDCCGRSIASTEVLYEIEVPSDCARSLAMHLLCFEIWVGESRKRDAARLQLNRSKAA